MSRAREDGISPIPFVSPIVASLTTLSTVPVAPPPFVASLPPWCGRIRRCRVLLLRCRRARPTP
eukprot:1836086-Prorocentrum_lima.AAC.1